MCAAVDPWREAAAATLRSPAPWSSEGFARLHEVRAPKAGTVTKLFRAAGEQVKQGDPLVEID